MRFLRNSWYVAGWSDELKSVPLARRILDEPVVIFRMRGGKAHAFADRCPHRFAPLSLGKVQGKHLRCVYHGLEFDGQGACVHNPHGSLDAFARTRIKTYPVAERHQAIWVWMGGVEPDEQLIPDISYIDDDPSIRTVKGSICMKADYRLVMDNLMDLSHAVYLHADTIATPEMIGGLQTAHRSLKPNGVEVTMWSDNVPPPTFWRQQLPAEVERINFRTEMTWYPGSNLLLDVYVDPVDGREVTPEWPRLSRSVHLLTPETSTSTRYYWTSSRTNALNDPQMDRFVYDMVTRAFVEQDEPVIEAQQDSIGASDLLALKPVWLPIDAAPMRVRRKLTQLIAREENARANMLAEAGH